MVCDKCQKKLGKVICPDPWKSGARNTTEGGGRKVNENKLLTQKKNRFTPYSTFNKCKICKQTVHQAHSHYCQGCAYKKGNCSDLFYLCDVFFPKLDRCICAMCGKQVLDTSNYRQTSV